MRERAADTIMRTRTSWGRVTGRMAFTVALGLFGALSVCGSLAFAQRYMFGRADFTTGAGPQSVALGDFNGDGRQDLAVVNRGSNSISVLLGNGDGTFQAAVEYGAGAAPVWASAGDFSGDGKL